MRKAQNSESSVEQAAGTDLSQQIEEESKGANDSDRSESDCGCAQVLVVDDNDFNLSTFREILLKNYGIATDGAANGLIAVEKFEQSLGCCPYRLVFMDVNMPVMNGIEATQRINALISTYKQARPNETAETLEARRQRVSAVHIIALTANETEDERERCLAAGMTGFMSKPPDWDQVGKTLAELLGIAN